MTVERMDNAGIAVEDLDAASGNVRDCRVSDNE
jgi:hypothetical protein